MSKGRRIEVTAFRSATVVFRQRSGRQEENKHSVKVRGGELPEAGFTDLARSREWTLLIDALVNNDGDYARAAGQLGLSRTEFVSQLLGLTLE